MSVKGDPTGEKRGVSAIKLPVVARSFFAIAGHKVWGATAIVLSEFVARMRRVLENDE